MWQIIKFRRKFFSQLRLNKQLESVIVGIQKHDATAGRYITYTSINVYPPDGIELLGSLCLPIFKMHNVIKEISIYDLVLGAASQHLDCFSPTLEFAT